MAKKSSVAPAMTGLDEALLKQLSEAADESLSQQLKEAAKDKRGTTFYVRTFGKANDAVAELLGENADESLCYSKKCSGGRFNLWRVNDDVIAQLNSRQRQFNLEFDVLVQKGDGPLTAFVPKTKKAVNLAALVKKGIPPLKGGGKPKAIVV